MIDVDARLDSPPTAWARRMKAAGLAVSFGSERRRKSGAAPDVRHALGWRSLAAADPDGDLAVVATLEDPADDLPMDLLGTARSCDRVITTSSASAEHFASLGIGRDQLVVLPGAVDTSAYRPGPEGPALRSGPRPRRLVCVVREFTVEALVDVLIALRRLPGARLLVAGGPPATALRADPAAREIAGIAARLRVADRVLLLGDVPASKLVDLYRSADAVVCPDGYTGTAAALNAMACGTPVVAYAEGGIADVVVPGVSGVLVEPGSAAALTRGMQELMMSEPRRYAYAAAGLSRVTECFSWDRISARLADLYRAAVADRQNLITRTT